MENKPKDGSILSLTFGNQVLPKVDMLQFENSVDFEWTEVN